MDDTAAAQEDDLHLAKGIVFSCATTVVTKDDYMNRQNKFLKVMKRAVDLHRVVQDCNRCCGSGHYPLEHWTTGPLEHWTIEADGAGRMPSAGY